MIVIAVTGGVACGKSAVARGLLAALPEGRTRRFDCDEAVRNLMENEEVLDRIRKIDDASSDLFEGGALQKGKLRKRAFDNSEFRERLENVLHPLVLDQASQFCEDCRDFADLVLMEVPLLYEVDFPLARDLDLVVSASKETQRARLQNDRHLCRELADRIIASQLPIEEKMTRGDIVVWNDGPLDVLEEQIRHLAERCLPFFN
jgi:dephospho-CoA kinase